MSRTSIPGRADHLPEMPACVARPLADNAARLADHADGFSPLYGRVPFGVDAEDAADPVFLSALADDLAAASVRVRQRARELMGGAACGS